VTKHGVISRYR